MGLLSQWKYAKECCQDKQSRLSLMKANIRSNLETGIRSSRDYWAIENRNITLLKNKKTAYQELGRSLGDAIRNDSFSNARIACMNATHYSVSIGFEYDFFDTTFNVEIARCVDCNYLDALDEFNRLYDDGDYLCNECTSNYYWNDDAGYYQNDPVEYDDDDYDHFTNIGDYHSSKQIVGHIPSKFDQHKPKVLAGLELEVEVIGDRDRDEHAGRVLDALGKITVDGKQYTYACCEHDGSLDHGFEIVTGYTGLDIHRKQLQNLENAKEGLKSHNTSTCGLHIHLCKSDMTTLHASKLILFINDPSNQRLVHSLARRDESSYAKFKDKKSDLSWIKNALDFSTKERKLMHMNMDRYESLNFMNPKTIEYRLFRGTLKYETLIACLEFAYATWFFTRSASIQQLTTDHFIQFICQKEQRSETRYLRAYLKNKGFAVDPVVLKLPVAA